MPESRSPSPPVEDLADAINAVDEILGPPLASGCASRAALRWGADQSLSFDELNTLVNRYGQALRNEGVKAGQRVFFLLDDSPELVAAYLGAMRVGGIAVALNMRLAAKDLLFILDDASPAVLFIHVDLLSLYREIEAALTTPPRLVVLGRAIAADDDLAAFLAGASTRDNRRSDTRRD